MAVIREEPSTGYGAALGVVIGLLVVLVLLVGAWWFFFRQPAVVEQPDNTNIQLESPQQTPQQAPQQQAPQGNQGDTNIIVPEGNGGTNGGSGESSPAP